MVPNKAKTYEMRFNWLKFRQAQEQFDLIWRPVKDNKADYHSKVHPIRHYVSKRKENMLDRQYLDCKGVLNYWVPGSHNWVLKPRYSTAQHNRDSYIHLYIICGL